MSETGETRRDPGEGTLERAGDRWRLRFARDLPHSPEKVRRALTEEEHLAGEPPAEHAPERWKPLSRLYTERFGPEAAAIGPQDSMEGYRD